MEKDFEFASDGDSTILSITPNGTLEILSSNSYSNRIYGVRVTNTQEALTALRDWCNEVLGESEPKRVSAFEDHFAEVRKRIGQVGFKGEE